MTRRQGGRRTLVLTVASAPRFCRVCDGAGTVRLVALPDLTGGGQVTCPHCRPEPGRAPIPIYAYVLREDRPRGDAA